jgi:hypothetical protein
MFTLNTSRERYQEVNEGICGLGIIWTTSATEKKASPGNAEGAERQFSAPSVASV